MRPPKRKIADLIFWVLLVIQIVASVTLFSIWGRNDYRGLRTTLIVFLVGTGPATIGAMLMGFTSEYRGQKPDENKK